MANATSQKVAALLRAGRFLEARDVLGSASEPIELLERARIHIHFGEYVEAEELAVRAIAPGGASPLALAVANAARAAQGLADYAPIDLADLGGEDLSPALYFFAMAAYFRNEFVTVDTWLGAHAPAEPAMRARYLMLRGFAAAGRGDFAAQLELAGAAVQLLRAAAPDETYLLAVSAHVTSLLLRELPFEGYDYLGDLERELPWPDDLAAFRFQVLRTLGWKLALQGAFIEAMRYLLRAALHADDPIRRAYALLDRATIALFANERLSARSDFAVAAEIVDRVEWARVRDETIALLPYAAQVAAELDDTERARDFYEKAVRFRKQIDARWALAHDERFAGFLAEAAAFTFFDTKRRRAIREATHAYEIFARIGFAWRAGRLAALLYSATHDVNWHARAQEWFAYYPDSPLQRLLPGKSTRRKTVRPLSPRQREVFRLMRQGKTGTEIGAQLGISTLTVRNHEQAVMRYYKVHRRYDLQQMAE